jgi:hypothetical protein
MKLTGTNQPCGLTITFSLFKSLTHHCCISYPYHSIIEILYTCRMRQGSSFSRGHRPHTAGLTRSDPSGSLEKPAETESSIFGGHSEEVTPVPIPNTAVKLLCADGTAWATGWESRSPPNPFINPPHCKVWGISFCRPALKNPQAKIKPFSSLTLVS